MPPKKIKGYLAGGLAWLAALGTGFALLMNYENTPGKTLPLVSSWPQHTALRPGRQQPTLIMFVHPQCPCSRASLSELAELMREFQGRVKTYVLVYQPSHFPQNWNPADTASVVGRIPGVSLIKDLDAQEATLFHAAISGQTVLYSPSGQLMFSGGITPARGQVGANAGRARLTRLLVRQMPNKPSHSFVFGCPILYPDSLTLAHTKD